MRRTAWASACCWTSCTRTSGGWRQWQGRAPCAWLCRRCCVLPCSTASPTHPPTHPPIAAHTPPPPPHPTPAICHSSNADDGLAGFDLGQPEEANYFKQGEAGYHAQVGVRGWLGCGVWMVRPPAWCAAPTVLSTRTLALPPTAPHPAPLTRAVGLAPAQLPRVRDAAVPAVQLAVLGGGDAVSGWGGECARPTCGGVWREERAG